MCVCAYIYIYVCIYTYVCLCINETTMIQGTGGKNSDYFVVLKYLYYPCNDIVLFESGLGLIVNIYCKLSTTKKYEKINIIRCY